jgi:hypothetical protein
MEMTEGMAKAKYLGLACAAELAIAVTLGASTYAQVAGPSPSQNWPGPTEQSGPLPQIIVTGYIIPRAGEARSALEAEITASRNGSELIAQTKGIEIYRVDRSSVEGRTKLRLFLAQRIERIELTFEATILMPAGDERHIPIRPGKGHTIARIIFKGGAEKMAIFDGKKIVLMELGENKPLNR